MIPQQTANWCLRLVGGRFLIRKLAVRALAFAHYSVSGEADFVFVPTKPSLADNSQSLPLVMPVGRFVLVVEVRVEPATMSR